MRAAKDHPVQPVGDHQFRPGKLGPFFLQGRLPGFAADLMEKTGIRRFHPAEFLPADPGDPFLFRRSEDPLPVAAQAEQGPASIRAGRHQRQGEDDVRAEEQLVEGKSRLHRLIGALIPGADGQSAVGPVDRAGYRQFRPAKSGLAEIHGLGEDHDLLAGKGFDHIPAHLFFVVILDAHVAAAVPGRSGHFCRRIFSGSADGLSAAGGNFHHPPGRKVFLQKPDLGINDGLVAQIVMLRRADEENILPPGQGAVKFPVFQIAGPIIRLLPQPDLEFSRQQFFNCFQHGAIFLRQPLEFGIEMIIERKIHYQQNRGQLHPFIEPAGFDDRRKILFDDSENVPKDHRFTAWSSGGAIDSRNKFRNRRR